MRLMYEKLTYTNSAGKSVEFSTSSLYHVNIRKDVSGLFGVKTSIYNEQVVNVDGATETGYHVEMRDIDINGTIKSRSHTEQDNLVHDLISVLSPFYTGVLRHEASVVREIDVRVEVSPDPKSKTGQRWPTFNVALIALNPNWRELNEKTSAIAASGTDIAYMATKPCGVEITITAKEDEIDIGSLSITNGDDVATVTFRNAGGVNLMTDDVLVLDTTPESTSVLLNTVIALERIDFDNTDLEHLLLYPGINTITWDVNIPAYSASSTYALGAFVTYSGSVCECTTAIETPEAWTAGHWMAVALADLFDVSIAYTPQYISL